MPKVQNDSINDKPYILTNTPAVISVLALLIFIVFGWLWWNKIYIRPRNVFEDMLKNNLATSSVTKTTKSVDGSSNILKNEQLSFVPNIASRALLTINQPGPEGDTKVVTESIGTLTADYSQYTKIDTPQKNAEGKKLDYSKVLNQWGKSNTESGPPQNLQQSILGLVPFARISPNERREIIKMLINDGAYVVDYSKVEPRKVGNKSALVFPVSINTEKYLKTLKVLAKKGGLSDLKSLDPAQYKDNPAIKVKLVIEKSTRHLLELDFEGSDQKETYSSYGLNTPINVPEKSISIEELQQKIQEIK